MNDKARLAITGAVALVALVATVGGHGLHFQFGDDDEPGVKGTRATGDLKDFDGVVAAGPDDVVITHGAAFSIKAEGDSGALDKLRLYVRDRTLHVERQQGWSGNHGDSATVSVTMPMLDRVTLTGPGDMRVDRLDGKQVKAQLVGTGDLSIGGMAAESADLSLTGAGDLTAAGTAKTASLKTTGAGDIAASKLLTEQASVKVIGVGDISVHASRTADISVMGPGNARVSGTTSCTISKMGPGDADCTG